MLVKILIRLCVLLCLPISVSAQLNDLNDIHHYRYATFRLLGWDTTGTSFMTTAEMNQFVLRGIDQLPVWAFGREVTKVITLADGTEQYYLDSLASQVVSVRRTDNNNWNTLKQIAPGMFNDVFDVDSTGDEDEYKPLAYHFWGDSLWVYPIPRRVDNLRVAYYQEPTVATSDSVISLNDKYQYGVVLWAAWQATRRAMGPHSQENMAAKMEYYEWVKQMQTAIITRPRDRLKNETP